MYFTDCFVFLSTSHAPSPSHASISLMPPLLVVVCSPRVILWIGQCSLTSVRLLSLSRSHRSPSVYNTADPLLSLDIDDRHHTLILCSMLAIFHEVIDSGTHVATSVVTHSSIVIPGIHARYERQIRTRNAYIIRHPFNPTSLKCIRVYLCPRCIIISGLSHSYICARAFICTAPLKSTRATTILPQPGSKARSAARTCRVSGNYIWTQTGPWRRLAWHPPTLRA